MVRRLVVYGMAAEDMVGNVSEWCADWWDDGYYKVSPKQSPQGPTAGTYRLIRGGAFDTYFDNQATCQFRSGENPVARKHNIGFRCAVSFCDVSIVTSPESEIPVADSAPDAFQGDATDLSVDIHDSVLQEATS